MRTRRILYNTDTWNIATNAAHPHQPLTGNAAKQYVREVANSQVDTFLICVNADLLFYPGGPWPMYGESGYETNLDDKNSTGKNLRRLADESVDLLHVLIETAREENLEVLLSYRMNDLHNVKTQPHMLPPFWQNHPEWRVDANVQFGGGYNYGVPEVRAFILDMIRHSLQRYGCDVDGVELDWMRFPGYFQPGQIDADALTDFTRKVRHELDAIRPDMSLSARVWNTMQRCQETGFDPVEWAREGLIDFLTLSRFLRNGEGRTLVGEFKKYIPHLPMYTCIEVMGPNIWPQNEEELNRYRALESQFLMTDDQYRAEAMQLWNDGADGIYLFNFFVPREYGKEPHFSLLQELGTPQTIFPTVHSVNYPREMREIEWLGTDA